MAWRGRSVGNIESCRLQFTVSFSVKSVFRRPQTAKNFRPAGAVSRGLWGGTLGPAQNRLPWPSPSSPSPPTPRRRPGSCTSKCDYPVVCVHNIHVKCCDSPMAMHGRSTCTCQCHLFWPHSSKVAPAWHPWPARGDGLSESTVATNLNATGPTIHRPNTPQSTGPTLLNPPAQHFSIHRPNTPRSTGTIIHPPKIHPHDTFGIIHWTDKSTGPTNLNPPS